MKVDLANLKVLVVDDSSTMVRIVSNTLKRIGIENIFTGADGIEGLEQFKISKPNMVLTDWNMPNMNGLELIKKIRLLDKDVPIVMITTEGGKREVITALKAGANNYIVKPFTPQVLKQKLEDILQ
jgi:two-component system chemotaxis response regulator CheY